jgi:hypothetical protein
MAANVSVTMALAALILAGCGGKAEPDAQEAPSATGTPTVSASKTTPIPKPSPTTLTREQAGKRYLALTAPINAVFDEPKCSQAEDFMIDGGTWPPDAHPSWDDQAWRILRSCYRRIVPLYAAWDRAAASTPWPVDARADVADLISYDQAIVYCMKKGAQAKSEQDIVDVFTCIPKDDGIADRVRARFGLPIRTSS